MATGSWAGTVASSPSVTPATSGHWRATALTGPRRRRAGAVDRQGYRLAAADGGVFCFGSAPFVVGGVDPPGPSGRRRPVLAPGVARVLDSTAIRSMNRSAARDDSARHRATTSTGVSRLAFAARASASVAMWARWRLQHGRQVDAAGVGEDQLQEQLAAQVTEMHDRGVERLAELSPTLPGGGHDRAIAAGDAPFLTHRLDEAGGGELVEGAVGQRAGAPTRSGRSSAVGLQPRGDGEAMGRPRVEDAEAGPFTQEELVGRRRHGRHRPTSPALRSALWRARHREGPQTTTKRVAGW